MGRSPAVDLLHPGDTQVCLRPPDNTQGMPGTLRSLLSVHSGRLLCQVPGKGVLFLIIRVTCARWKKLREESYLQFFH